MANLLIIRNSIIKVKYLKAGYLDIFINSVINSFHQTKEDFLIPPTLFEKRGKKIVFRYHFEKRSEKKIKRIIFRKEEYSSYKTYSNYKV